MGASTSEYASGGTTLVEVIRGLEAQGYTAQMAAEEPGLVRCFECHQTTPADEVGFHELHRTEGASDPADMAAVAALECPHCGARGTAALKYGPGASLEEQQVLATLEEAHEPIGPPEGSG